MSRGRMVDAIFLGVGIMIIIFAQAAGAQMLDETKESVLDMDWNKDFANGEEHIHGMYTMVTVWTPTAAGAGLIILAAYREFRRQKRAGQAPPGGGPI
jgi:hypothetical protein